MKTHIIFLYFLFFLVSCNKSKEDLSEKLIQNSQRKNYIALVCDEIEKNSFDLTKKEVLQTEELLSQAIKELNKKSKENVNPYEKEFEIDLRKYKRQFCASIDKNGDKTVYVLGINEDNIKNNSWETKWYRVAGGGSNYFHGGINLTKNKYFSFGINAPK
ncbi:hypothetical protein [Flavobacterium sp. J27]|uniref:hypothetical protein n=1 Tax=Flavobacterium sp. J27 TaxID=2060419 RepID=UPI001030CE95|nr:hypothetical protein [Flavobacterium sp. J27]